MWILISLFIPKALHELLKATVGLLMGLVGVMTQEVWWNHFEKVCIGVAAQSSDVLMMRMRGNNSREA